MGHLFTAGGQTVDGDGVRELYVGSLAHVTAGIFPEALDYVALGHLHVPQVVGGREFVRYSGSPLAMGFGEAAQAKQVCVVEFAPEKTVRLLPVPVFQRLERVTGDWPQIEARLTALKAAGEFGLAGSDAYRPRGD
jgi:exonuclease SbcD